MKIKKLKNDKVEIKGTVSEMAQKLDNLKIDVPFAEGVDVTKLTKGDKHPLFVTIEAVNDTISKGKRRYTPEVINDIARQINEIKPDGYEGHLKDEDRPYVRPKSQTIWIGASVKNVEGKVRLFIKGYVFPYAKDLRQYLKAAKAAGKKVAVSIYGQAQHVWNNVLKAYDLKNMTLESIDWARSGSEGVPSLGYMQVASEMKGKVGRKKIIKSLELTELKEFNPELVKEMEMEIKVRVVSEMKNNQEKIISEMQGKIDNLQKEVIDKHIESVLKSKIVSETVRKVVKSLIVREIGSEVDVNKVKDKISVILSSDECKTIVREMTKTSNGFNPVEDRESPNSRKYTT